MALTAFAASIGQLKCSFLNRGSKIVAIACIEHFSNLPNLLQISDIKSAFRLKVTGLAASYEHMVWKKKMITQSQIFVCRILEIQHIKVSLTLRRRAISGIHLLNVTDFSEHISKVACHAGFRRSPTYLEISSSSGVIIWGGFSLLVFSLETLAKTRPINSHK